MRRPARWLLRLAARLAPAERRREFLAEWQAELAWDDPARGVWHDLRRASGALADALALRRRASRGIGLAQDVRLAVRLARRRPSVAVLVAGTLALGIGGSTAVFSVVNAVMLRPLPFRDADRLLVLWEDDRASGQPRTAVSPGAFADWTAGSRSFDGFMLYFAGAANLTSDGSTARVVIGSVSPGMHDVLGVRPILGPGFSTGDEAAAGADVVLVSHAAWQSRFGADPAIVGRAIVLNDTPRRVAGVMPRDFSLFDRGVEFWVPHVPRARAATIRNVGYLTVVGRLRDGVTPGMAQAEMDAIAASAARQFPATSANRGVTLIPMRAQIFGDLTQPLAVLSAAMAMVLLAACANMANLLLAAGVARRRELAVRAAVGASRSRLVRQMLIETLTLAIAGGGLGLVLAVGASSALGRLVATILPAIGDITPDWRVFAFALAATTLVGVLGAALPVVAASRTDLSRAFSGGSRVSTTPAIRRVAAGLVVAELILAVLLVSGGSLAVRSLNRVQAVPVGIDVDRLLTAQVTLPVSRYFGVEPILEFYGTVQDRLSEVPGVASVGLTNALPLAGPGLDDTLSVEGSALSAGEAPRVAVRAVTPTYFEAAGLPLLEGRRLEPADRTGALPVALINRTLAVRFYPDGDPVGRRIALGTRRGLWRTIVGVVGDVHHDGPERPPPPEVYVPKAQGYPFGTAALVVRVTGEPEAFAGALRAAVASVDPEIPVSDVRPMRALAGESVLGRQASAVLLAGLAGLTLVLALGGVYGVLAHSVNQRTGEFGIRMALGSPRSGLLRMVLRQGLTLTLAGLAAGLGLAVAAAELSRSMLFGVEPADPLTLAGVSVIVLLTAALACYLPARRAANLDPVTALRPPASF